MVCLISCFSSCGMSFCKIFLSDLLYISKTRSAPVKGITGKRYHLFCPFIVTTESKARLLERFSCSIKMQYKHAGCLLLLYLTLCAMSLILVSGVDCVYSSVKDGSLQPSITHYTHLAARRDIQLSHNAQIAIHTARWPSRTGQYAHTVNL